MVFRFQERFTPNPGRKFHRNLIFGFTGKFSSSFLVDFPVAYLRR